MSFSGCCCCCSLGDVAPSLVVVLCVLLLCCNMCFATLCCATLFCAAPGYATPCYVKLCYATLRRAVLCRAALCLTMFLAFRLVLPFCWVVRFGALASWCWAAGLWGRHPRLLSLWFPDLVWCYTSDYISRYRVGAAEEEGQEGEERMRGPPPLSLLLFVLLYWL